MDCVEDSGFDSDQQKPGKTKEMANSCQRLNSTTEEVVVAQIHSENSGRLDPNSSKGLKQSVEAHKKPDKPKSAMRKLNSGVVSQQPRHTVLSRNRLSVPSKSDVSSASDTQPLVIIDMDESEDEFAMPKLSKKAQREITQQLIKDGYNLDLEPDDEDLDLIPPRPLNERCICCNTQVNCGIQ